MNMSIYAAVFFVEHPLFSRTSLIWRGWANFAQVITNFITKSKSNIYIYTYPLNPTDWEGTTAQESRLQMDVGRCDAWGYSFHSSCWQLLTSFRGPTRKINAQCLLNLFRSFPSFEHVINFGHDYDGIWGTIVETLNLGIDERPGISLSHLTPNETPWYDRSWPDPMDMPII